MEPLDDIERKIQSLQLKLRLPRHDTSQLVSSVADIEAELHRFEIPCHDEVLESEITKERLRASNLRRKLVEQRFINAQELERLEECISTNNEVASPITPALEPDVEEIRENYLLAESDTTIPENSISSFDVGFSKNCKLFDRFKLAECDALASLNANSTSEVVIFNESGILWRKSANKSPVHVDEDVIRVETDMFEGNNILIHTEGCNIVDLCGCRFDEVIVEADFPCKLVDLRHAIVNSLTLSGEINFLRVSSNFKTKVIGFNGTLVVQE